MKLCLLIDDDLDDQEIFELCLKQVDDTIGFKSANDGIYGKDMLNDGTYIPDCIFIDVNMPRMDGITCLQELKKMEHLKETQIYMYSTTSQQSFVEKSKELGAVGFIIKPSKATELINTLSKIFQNFPG